MTKKNKKAIALLITVILIMACVPPGFAVSAQGSEQPPIINKILFISEKPLQGEASLRYEIYGTGFDYPTVFIDGKGVTPDSYNSFMIQIKWKQGVSGDIFSPGPKTIAVQNSNGQGQLSDAITFEVVAPPQVDDRNKGKAYVGESLEIHGSGFKDAPLDSLYIAENAYTIGEVDSGADAIIKSDSLITVENLKSFVTPGLSNIRLTRNAGNKTSGVSGDGVIQGILADCITVVSRLIGIEVARVEPNTGPVTGGTLIRMYGTPDNCSFRDDMKVYIDGVPATEVRVMADSRGNIIGLQAKTPPGGAGSKKIVIMNADESSEYEVGPEFTYLQAGNSLTIQSVVPNMATETEEAEITVNGRNIATINIGEIDDIEFIKGSYDKGTKEYILEFTGTYDEEDVNIIRKIKLTIGDVARITEVELIDKEGDIMEAITPIITLDPQVMQAVDVVVQTETIVSSKEGIQEEKLHRSEEYVLKNGFTYRPSKTHPEILGIVPDRGPCDKEIYINIIGAKFQVLTVTEEVNGEIKERTLFPIIQIGGKTIDPNRLEDADYMEVYDNEGNRLEGYKYQLGNIIKTKIPQGPVVLPRFVDVTVTNPDLGSRTVENMFEFKRADRPQGDMPVITGIEPVKGSVDGGETLRIYGRNFDNSIEDLIVTIGGAAAEIKHINNTGTDIEVITPPGDEGYKTVQVINFDGSIATLENGYYYTRVKSSPVIDVIAPDHGGAGTYVTIKGKDFFPPDPESELIFNRLGTRILLNGIDIDDDYTLNDEDEIIFPPGGKRTEIVDEHTIKIKIPPDLLVGPKDVTVINPDTASYTVKDGFDYKYPASRPEIFDITGDGVAIDPDRGTIMGGTVVTIEGEDFRPGIRVFFGGTEAADVSVNDARTVIQAVTSAYTINDPAKDKEAVDITVVNYDGGSATEEKGFTYMVPYSSPVIYSVEPDFGSAAGGETIVVRGRDFRDKDGDGNHEQPIVYFGGVKAQSVVMANDNTLYAVTPGYPMEAKVDVTVINADAGTFVLKDGFEYRRSRPEIVNVIPSKGSRRGDQEIVIHGKDFRKSDLSSYYEDETVYKHVYGGGHRPNIDLLVVFGEESTREHIIGGNAHVTLGDLKVTYEHVYDDDEANTKLYYVSPEGAESLITSYDIDTGDRHLFIINGPGDLNDSTIVDEGVLVEVVDNMLEVTRRVAPHASVVDSEGTTVVVKTPPVPYIGDRPLRAINKDGGTAAAIFEYTNPDSNPLIFDIQPCKEMYDEGGNVGGYHTVGSVDADTYITIYGADFRTGVRVFVEDIEAEVVNRSNDDNELTVRVPRGKESYIGRLLRIVVVNRDGGTVDSSLLPIPRWFTYEKPGSGPLIDFVTPDKTSAAGGNRLEIYGDDLRAGAVAVIGGISTINIDTENWTYKRITVITPEGMVPGVYDLQVINPDYGTATFKNGLTVISWPRINYITNENGGIVDEVSFLGGDVVYIKGSGFMPGARVAFGGEIVSPSQAPGGGLRGFSSGDENVVIINGKEAMSVELVDESTLKIVTPAGVEGDSIITVINQDEGMSDPYAIGYKPPVPDTPEGLDISLVYDRYVRLQWPEVPDALYYEIYARKGTRGEFTFMTSTTRRVYYITSLDSRTRYYFKVKSINKFGSSEFTDQRGIRTDDTQEEDIDGDIGEEEKVLVDGNSVTVNIPDNAFKRQYYYSIDLSGEGFAGKNEKTVNVPLSVIRGTSGTFILNAENILLQFTPAVLNVAPLWSVTKTDAERSYGRIVISSAGGDGERAKKYLPAKQRIASGLYYIGLSAIQGKTEEHCDAFNGQLYIQVKYENILPRDADIPSLTLHRFDPSALKWEPVDGAGFDIGSGFAYGYATKPGIYAILNN